MNDNRINFDGKTTAKVKLNGEQKHLEILVTTKKTNPLLGLDWMKKLGKTINKDNIDPQIKHVREDPDETILKSQFQKLFNENHTVIGVKVEIQLKKKMQN